MPRIGLRPLIATGFGAGLIAFPQLALAQDASTRQELENLRLKVFQLEERERGTVRTTSGVTLTIGGYVKTDFIYDLDQSLGDTFFTDGIDVDEDGESRFTAHARQSRFSLTTESETAQGPLRTFFEVDLFGNRGNEVFSNSHSLRLRHAMAEWNNLIVGQFWTNFMPIEVYPSTVDFEGPVGIPFVRQAQIRYTLPVSDRLIVSASLENSEFNGRDANGVFSESTTSGIRAGLDEIPDFTLAGTYEDDWGLVKLAGVARRLGSPTSDDSALGWGLNLSGRADLWEGGAVVASLTGGEGIGRYLINGFGQDAFVDADGDIDPIRSWGAVLGVTHDLNPQVTLGLTGGYYAVEDTFAPTDTDNLATVHASVFWKPVDRVTVGTEIIYGRREIASGESADNTRLQAALQVAF